MHDTVASAVGILGAKQGLQGLPSGVEQLERSLAIAEQLPGAEDLVGRTHVLLAMAGCRGRSLELMERYVEAGLAYCAERDLDVWSRLLLATRSWIALERGDWERAAETVELVFMEDCTMSCLQARVVLGLLRARRGDPDLWTPLAEAREVAERTRHLWWEFQVAAAEAEALHLSGRPDEIADATAEPFESATRLGAPARRRARPGGAARVASARRSRRLRAAPSNSSSAATGGGAAAAWRTAGCPYEAALALGETDDEDALRRALDELQGLGARPAATIVARRLRGAARAGCRAGRAGDQGESGEPHAAGSPRSSRWSLRASGTPRSRSGSWCRSGPSITTSARSCASSGSAAESKPLRKPNRLGLADEPR